MWAKGITFNTSPSKTLQRVVCFRISSCIFTIVFSKCTADRQKQTIHCLATIRVWHRASLPTLWLSLTGRLGRLMFSTAGTQISGKARHRTGGNISFTLHMTITVVFPLVWFSSFVHSFSSLSLLSSSFFRCSSFHFLLLRLAGRRRGRK